MQHANYTDINDLLGDLRRALKVHPTEKPTLKAIADLAERDGLEAGIAAFANWQNAIASGGKMEPPQPATPESAQAIENSDRLTALFKQLAEQSHQHLVSDANGTFTLDRPIEEIEAKYAETAHAILRECLERAARFFLEKSTGQVQPEMKQDKQKSIVCKHPAVLALLKELKTFISKTERYKIANLSLIKRDPEYLTPVIIRPLECGIYFDERVYESFSFMGPELLCSSVLLEGRLIPSYKRVFREFHWYHAQKVLRYIDVLQKVVVDVIDERCENQRTEKGAKQCVEKCNCKLTEFWAISLNAIEIAEKMLLSGADLHVVSNTIFLRRAMRRLRASLLEYGECLYIKNIKEIGFVFSEQEFNQTIACLQKLGLLCIHEEDEHLIPLSLENEFLNETDFQEED